jgi:hypothetical protein
MTAERWRGRSVLIAARSCFEWDLAAYVADALRADGVRAAVFEYRSFESPRAAGDALVQAVAQEPPDLLLGLKLEMIPPAALARVRSRGVPVALWYVDCFTAAVPDWIVPLLGQVDAFFTTAEGLVDTYQAHSPAPVGWLFEGVHVPAFPVVSAPATRYRSEVAFLGNVFQPPVLDESLALRRLRLLSRIGERFDLSVWGPQSPAFDRYDGSLPFRTIRWPAYNEECVKVCRAAAVVLGINTVDTVRLYFSNRTFLTLASGGFHLTGYVPGLETMFENGRHLVWYRSDEECLDLIDHYLARPEERARIGAEGRRYVCERYSLAGQVRRLLGSLEGLGVGP